MDYQAVFERYELKYLLNPAQKRAVLSAMAPYMALDQYGRDTIRNLYFDTDRFLLARRSIEKPIYKEKLRIRSYRLAAPESLVYVELKKKYQDIVHKRRLSMPERQAMAWTAGAGPGPEDTQIGREIAYFLRCYASLRPRVFLSYEREAYFEKNGGGLRVTLDENIRFREDRLSLLEEPGGVSLLAPGDTLMEVKCAGGFPLWLTEALSRERIYKTSFSKYGAAYKRIAQREADGAIEAIKNDEMAEKGEQEDDRRIFA